MQLLITGGSGLVGWDLGHRAASAGHDIAYTYYSTRPPTTDRSLEAHQVDIREADAVRKVVRRVNPDVVVHAAAMTDVDECERRPDRATAINVEGTRNVVDACRPTNAALLFVSTAFVFDGRREIYTEKDRRASVNAYGRTKLDAEDVVVDADLETTIIRIDQPFGWPTDWQDDTFVTWILDRCRQGDPFPVFTDWWNTPVYLPDLNEAVLALVEEGLRGTYHVCGPDYCSRFEWARTIADVFGYDPELVIEGHSDDTNIPAKRPNCRLSNEKVIADAGCSFRTIPAALDDMKRRMECDD